MKKIIVICLLMAVLVGSAHAETFDIMMEVEPLTIERSAVLDAALSMLENNHPLITRYNEITGAAIRGGMKFNESRYKVHRADEYTVDAPSVDQLTLEMVAGDYLKAGKRTFICIGCLYEYGYDDDENDERRTYPIVLYYDVHGVRIGIVGINEPISVDGLTVDPFDLSHFNLLTWYRI